MILLGVVSGIFSNVKFSIPGIHVVELDLREIPLLISLLYLRNPIYLVGISIISSFFTVNLHHAIVNFIVHTSGLLTIYYFAYGRFRLWVLKLLQKGIIGGFIVTFVYYFVVIFCFVLLEFFIIKSDNFHLLPFLKLIVLEGAFTAFVISFILMLYIHKYKLEQQIQMNLDELSKANLELKRTQQKLIQEEKLSSFKTFTAGIAHEINNPLNFINGAIYLINDLKNKVDEGSKNDWQQMSNMLKTGYNRIKKIVRDLTYFSYDTGYKIEKKDIHKIIGMALMMLRQSIPKGVRIKTNYKLKPLVPVHTENFHSVIVNLVSNAVYATTNSDTKIKLIEITTRQVGENAQITVYNTGNNIPSNEINKIFNPFFTTKSPQEGTGLGLSICYTLVNTHHNGQIKVENMPNGVKFVVTLPLKNSGVNN